MSKIFKFRATGLVLSLLAGSLMAEPPAGIVEEELPADGTVITSHSLQYDQTARMAVFDRDVVVKDPQLQIMADRLTVFFS
ncbi:MAG: hypothetical protein LC725_08490, partial [Lentisphaerae bacterium]|nr:hypothetical protein [Lentisphaerota bacterium]